MGSKHSKDFGQIKPSVSLGLGAFSCNARGNQFFVFRFLSLIFQLHLNSLTSKFCFIATKENMQALNNNSASLLRFLYWRNCGNTVCYEQGLGPDLWEGKKYLVVVFSPYAYIYIYNVKSINIIGMHLLAGQEVMMCVREILP